jgi:2-haloacid dehalogenase
VAFDAGIFDLGGVLIDWNPRYLYRKLFPGDLAGMERFLAEVCTPAWNLELDGGRPFQEAIDELKAAHPDQAPLIQAYWDRWPEMLGDVDQSVAALLRELRQEGLRLFSLSNWSAQTFAATRGRVPELGLFDDILVSGEAGHVKPDPELFALAIRRFGVVPGHTFFVDDVPANVDGARRQGLTAIQFADARGLRRDLARLGVLRSGF